MLLRAVCFVLAMVGCSWEVMEYGKKLMSQDAAFMSVYHGVSHAADESDK